MTEPESVTHVRGGPEPSRNKGKTKAVIKRSKSETPSKAQPEQVAESRRPERDREPAPPSANSEARPRDLNVIARIRQRAYGLFEAGGREHGHDLEHWLEAERQITESSER